MLPFPTIHCRRTITTRGGGSVGTADLNAWFARQWPAVVAVRKIADALGIGEGTVYLRATKTLGLPKRAELASGALYTGKGDLTAAEVVRAKDMYLNGADAGAIAATLDVALEVVDDLIKDKAGRGIWTRRVAEKTHDFKVVDPDLSSPAATTVLGEGSTVVHADGLGDEVLGEVISYLERQGFEIQLFRGLYDVVEGTVYRAEELDEAALMSFANKKRASAGLTPFAA